MLRLIRFLLRWLEGITRRQRRPRSEPLPLLAPRPAPRGRLEIDYAPRRDGDADPGEVVWTWVPYEEDASQGKDRPVLVVGSRGGELVGIALTSRDVGRGDRVEIGPGPWDREGRSSFAKLDRLIPLRGAIRREGAVLDRARFERVVQRLRAHGAG